MPSVVAVELGCVILSSLLGWARLGSLLWPRQLDFWMAGRLILISPFGAYLLEQGLCFVKLHVAEPSHHQLSRARSGDCPWRASRRGAEPFMTVHTAASKGGHDLERAALFSVSILKL